jgi:lysophospholipase L1-like esterase
MRAEAEVGGIHRRRLATVALVVALALLATFAAAAARAANYVSLGDSYAAGPLIPNQSLSPLGCLRSSNNYSHLAAPSIGLPLRDPSCSGAKTNHMTEQQNVEPGPNPPQFNSLDAETTVVSITIGGNDIGFSEVAQSCITINPFATPCKDKYNAGGKDQLAERIAATAPKVDAVLDGIRARSPLAKIYVVNYPAIFPETGFGCWPQMPIGFGDVPYLRQTEKNLNAMLAAQAAANGATLVDWYKASIGHDACKSTSTRWVEPLIPSTLAAPIHPNKAGMQGGANALVAAL